jgi:hypothetical protein
MCVRTNERAPETLKEKTMDAHLTHLTNLESEESPMSAQIQIEPVLKDDALYFGDNGVVYCGKHHGSSARFSGRDISGQRVALVTDKDHEFARTEGFRIRCEDPRCA